MRAGGFTLVAFVLAACLSARSASAESPVGTGSPGQAAASFNLGFKALAAQIPDVVGQPLEDEHWGANGDSLQQTTTGLMVWRKADNWTAFTNGSTTWIAGPFGVQSRANGDRFPWETQGGTSPLDPAEVILYDRQGSPSAYIAAGGESTIYLWTGEPVAYLVEDHVYGFNGHHLGWYQDGVVWDYTGVAVGFTSQTLPVDAKPEPARSARLPSPPRLPREAAPAEPPLTKGVFTESLATLLRLGE
jgi:hypothetical protein